MGKPLIYDRHAKRRMKWRRISQEEVESVLNNPDKVEPTKMGRSNAFKRMGTRYLKVTYKELPDAILIISAVDKSD